MAGKRVRERPSRKWFFYVGLALFALSTSATVIFAPYAPNYGAAAVFLTLCLPRIVAGVRAALTASSPGEWEKYGRDGMARVSCLRESSTDDVNKPYYTAKGVLRPTGKQLSIEGFQFPDGYEEAMRAMEALPVRYLPVTQRAQIRTDLARMVLDCVDPLTQSPTGVGRWRSSASLDRPATHPPSLS